MNYNVILVFSVVTVYTTITCGRCLCFCK